MAGEARQGQCCFIPRDLALLVADTVTLRSICLQASGLGQSLGPSTLARVLPQFLSLIDDLFPRVGNQSYKIIKMWESLAVGYLINRPADLGMALPSEKEFFETCHRDLTRGLVDLENSGALAQHVSTLILASIDQLLSTGDQEPGVLVDLFGLYRIWGHPLVDSIVGCKKVKLIAQAEEEVEAVVLSARTRAIKEAWVKHYFLKKSWPPVRTQVPNARGEVHRAYRRHTLPRKAAKDYEPSDWNLIEIDKALDFNYHPDYTELLKYRACSYPLSMFDYIFAAGTTPYRVEDKMRFQTFKRVILMAIVLPEVDLEKLITRITEDGFFDEKLVIGVNQKEREMKLESRLFSKLVFTARMYFSTLEANVSTLLGEYFPEQTMTSPELSKVRKENKFLDNLRYHWRFFHYCSIDGESSKIRTALSLHVLMNIDFKSWNLYRRPVVTFLTMKFLGDVFGMGLAWVRANTFFSQALVFLADSLHPPTTLDNEQDYITFERETAWYNHNSGFEGIMQKAWTLDTTLDFIVACEDLNIPYQLMGQCDNQLLQFKFDYRPPMTYHGAIRMTESLIKSIKRRLHVIGTKELKPLKIDETYHTTSIMAYSKNVTIHVVEQSMLLKKLCRQNMETNDLEPIVDTLLSGVGSAGIAAVSKASEPFLPMLWTVFGTVNQIYSVPHGTTLCLRSDPLTFFDDTTAHIL